MALRNLNAGRTLIESKNTPSEACRVASSPQLQEEELKKFRKDMEMLGNAEEFNKVEDRLTAETEHSFLEPHTQFLSPPTFPYIPVSSGLHLLLENNHSRHSLSSTQKCSCFLVQNPKCLRSNRKEKKKKEDNMRKRKENRNIKREK
jgi:hypothetical protein